MFLVQRRLHSQNRVSLIYGLSLVERHILVGAQLVIMFVGSSINLNPLALQSHSHAKKGSAKGKNKNTKGSTS